MWVARDKDGTLRLWTNKPFERFTQTNGEGYWTYYKVTEDGILDYGEEIDNIVISNELFPDLKWEDEPIEVSIVPNNILDDIRDSMWNRGMNNEDIQNVSKGFFKKKVICG